MANRWVTDNCLSVVLGRSFGPPNAHISESSPHPASNSCFYLILVTCTPPSPGSERLLRLFVVITATGLASPSTRSKVRHLLSNILSHRCGLLLGLFSIMRPADPIRLSQPSSTTVFPLRSSLSTFNNISLIALWLNSVLFRTNTIQIM